MTKYQKPVKALYIHIPFCDHICIYCDFYKMIAKDDKISEYINYLKKELLLKKDLFNDLETIYIGGGTPSILNKNLLKSLLEAINSNITISNIKEFTIEANPRDITKEFIDIIKDYHVNRISLGVQSTNNEKLKFLNRNHTKDDVINAISILDNENFNNVNCDLIYGVNNDSLDLIINDIKTITNYKCVKHLSCYSLIIEDKTVLSKMIKEKNYQVMDEDFDVSIYEGIVKELKKLGFNHYEISNYSITGYESIHNLTYWNSDYYYGLGANASFYYDNTRFTNPSNLNKYYESIDNYPNNHDFIYKEKIKLDIDDLKNEYLILGLRKTKGISISNYYERFNSNLLDDYKSINNLIKEGFLEINDDYLFIKENKIYIMNTILNKLISE